ncbi:MAG TPA: hypothetical protein VKM55_27615 [Candidatus Lokiarchaeia archaeon]|nr:hypothetical protein [Candidatus Lokiarchaeia archaeon]
MEQIISKMEDKHRDILVSFRLKSDQERDLLQAKADRLNLKVSEFLRQCINGQEIKENTDQRGLISSLIEDMGFMLKFFQKNYEDLKIDTAEAERFKKILQKLKEMREK